MNLDPNPNVTGVSGSCGVNSSGLLLTSNTMTVMLTFANVSPQHVGYIVLIRWPGYI